jgi:hypothetical protein
MRWLAILISAALLLFPAAPVFAQTIQIGETTILSADDNGNGTSLFAQQATLSQAATINSLSFYVTTVSGTLRLGIYDASGSGGAPGALRAQTPSFAATAGWNTASVITPVLLPPANYWLAYLPSSDGLGFKKQNDSGPCFVHYGFGTGPMPNAFPSHSSCSPTTWSFYASLTGGQSSGGSNIFGNSIPGTPAITSGTAATVGVKFWSSSQGTIAGIRFYRGRQNTHGYTTRLYSASGSVLGQGTSGGDVCTVPCWEEIDFASPIPIAANTTYVAAYYTSNGHYADDQFGLANGVTSGVLTAPASGAVGGNGVYVNANGFPTKTLNSSNYYVDVDFTPTTPVLSISFNPPAPSISSDTAVGTVVAAVTPSWSDGSPFTGTLSFGPPYSNDQGVFAISGNNVVLNASVSADGGTVQNGTIVATQ